MSLLKLFISLTAIFFLSACSVEVEKSAGESGDSGDFRYFDDTPSAQTAFQSAFIQCGEGECPESTVGVFTLKEDSFSSKMGACSGTLIAPDKVLTNQHCMPENLMEAGVSCAGQIRFSFAATGARAQEVVNCDRIEQFPIVMNKYDALRPDWVILKLQQPVQRQFRPLNRNSGIQSFQSVKLYKINFDLNQNVPNGVIQETSCLANTTHVLSRENIGPVSAVFNISDCNHKLISGNSGSGVVNEQGELVGVFSFINPIEDSSLESILAVRNSFPKMTQTMGGGTQVACIPFQNEPLPSLCEFKEDYGIRALVYRDLVSQQAHPNFQDTQFLIQQALLDENPIDVKWGAWGSKTESKLVFDKNLSAQEKFLARVELANLFPWIPHCVESAAASDFSLNWYKRTALDEKEEVIEDQQSWSRILPSQIQNTQLSFEKEDNQNYLLRLVLSDQSVTYLRLPLCR